VNTYKHVTGASHVPIDANYWAVLPRLKNPYIALDNGYRALVGDGGPTLIGPEQNASEARSNEMLEEVNFGNGVWVYKYTTEAFPDIEEEVIYVPVFSRKTPNGSYSHWIIEGPVETLPKALASTLAFIDCGFFTDSVAKSNTNC
jgi:hypothetical protein